MGKLRPLRSGSSIPSSSSAAWTVQQLLPPAGTRQQVSVCAARPRAQGGSVAASPTRDNARKWLRPLNSPGRGAGCPELLRSTERRACLQPEGRRWRLGLNLATPQLLELSGLGHGCDIAAAYGWYLMGKIPAKASFLTELKIKGGCGSSPHRAASEQNAEWPQQVPSRESSTGAAQRCKYSHNTGHDKLLTLDKRRKVFPVSSALPGGQRQGRGSFSLFYRQEQRCRVLPEPPPGTPWWSTALHCILLPITSPVLAAPTALLISPCHLPPKTIRGEKQGLFDTQRGKSQLQSPCLGGTRSSPASLMLLAPQTGGTLVFSAWFPEKRNPMCSLCLSVLFPRRTCRLVSQPHPQLTWTGILTTNSLQVLHKCPFFQPQRELCIAVSVPRPISS